MFCDDSHRWRVMRYICVLFWMENGNSLIVNNWAPISSEIPILFTACSSKYVAISCRNMFNIRFGRQTLRQNMSFFFDWLSISRWPLLLWETKYHPGQKIDFIQSIWCLRASWSLGSSWPKYTFSPFIRLSTYHIERWHQKKNLSGCTVFSSDMIIATEKKINIISRSISHSHGKKNNHPLRPPNNTMGGEYKKPRK